MAIVLDTSALIEMEKSLAKQMAPTFPSDEGVVIPAIVWAEAHFRCVQGLRVHTVACPP